MFGLSPDHVVALMHAMPPEIVWLLVLLLCFSTVLLMARLFGAVGLTAYMVLGLLGANLQVLKPVQFSVFSDPVALGTVLFASTYLATDMLTEHYGKEAACRAVLLGFVAFAFWTVLLLMTLGFRPITPDQAGEGLAWALPVHDAMATLFTPAPALFVAGMAAYLISQHSDIWIYSMLRKATRGRALWLRNNLSSWISALIDNTIFSLLAWIVLAAEPLPLGTVITTYILGTYGLRVVVAVLDTPFIYLARYAVRDGTAEAAR